MLVKINDAKTMTKHVSCYCKSKFNSTTSKSNHKWNKKTSQCKCKNYRTSICENSKYLKIIGDTSVIECVKL